MASLNCELHKDIDLSKVFVFRDSEKSSGNFLIKQNSLLILSNETSLFRKDDLP